MNLEVSVQKYVERKRAEGFCYETPAARLISFSRHVGNVPLENVDANIVLKFLNGSHTSARTWRQKYGLLKQFFDFWISRGEMPMLRMPAARPVVSQTFVPYIYSREQIRQLLRMARHYPTQHLCTIASQTMSTLLLVLYATGALIGEMLRLQTSDVNLKKDFISIRSNRFSRTRNIPLGPDLRSILQRYCNWKCRQGLGGTHFFVRQDGQSLVARTVEKHFQRIRLNAGISRNDGAAYQPRLHDLRATFAVHRITSWIKSDADLNRMLPALSAYMGQVGLASTERFLLLTPERFRKELDKLSPQRAKKHWRDNPDLMHFLAEL